MSTDLSTTDSRNGTVALTPGSAHVERRQPIPPSSVVSLSIAGERQWRTKR